MRKMVAVLSLAFVLGCVGCGGIRVINLTGGYRPTIPVDEKPELEKVTEEELKPLDPAVKKKLIENSDKLMLDNLKLRKVIGINNKDADKNNAHVREVLGLPPKPKGGTDVDQ